MIDADALAARMLAADDAASVLPQLFSDADPAFDLGTAWRVAERMRGLRIERGAVPRGWKIGFTNRRIWPRYGVHAPMWSTVYEHTLELLDGARARVALDRFVQPRIEPEIVFGLTSAPAAGMSRDALAGCVGWVAHGIEIVHTHCDGWRFRAADTVADSGLHGRLLVGPRVPRERFGAELEARLRALHVELLRDGELVERGDGSAALDGPLAALQQWVDAMALTTPQWPIRAGDVVTTGTLTDAWPVAHGQCWQTRLTERLLADLTIEFAPR